MIVRTWQTAIDPDRVDEFEAFVNTYSLPMFKLQPGCLGVLVSRDGRMTTTLSLWEDRASIDQLDTSTTYQETVERILATELLRGEQTVKIYPVFGGYLDLEAIGQQIPQ